MLDHRLLSENPRCKFCNQAFNPHHHTAKYCSEVCKEKEKIKKSNEKWIKRDPDWQEKGRIKREERTREINGFMNIAHVSEPKWSGKQYKSVRG